MPGRSRPADRSTYEQQVAQRRSASSRREPRPNHFRFGLNGGEPESRGLPVVSPAHFVLSAVRHPFPGDEDERLRDLNVLRDSLVDHRSDRPAIVCLRP